MGYTAIQHIVKETKRRVSMTDLPYEEEYRGQLKHLGYKEKDIVKEAFLRLDWNLGSARILCLLQESNILTASELILSLDSTERIQQVMNDLLETEYSLLCHIIKFAYQDNGLSQTLMKVLQDSFRALIADLKDDPNVIPRNYLQPIRMQLLPNENEWLKNEHLRLVLTTEEPFDLDEAIGRQEQWREEMHKVTESILGGLIVELIDNKAQVIGLLREYVQKSHPFSIKYALYLLNAMSKDTKESEDKLLKEFHKDVFRWVVDTGLMSQLQLLLLFARETCSSNCITMGTYSAWYKQTIGAMTYSVKKDQFIRTMEMLTALLPLETNLDVLDVHSTIAISAPAKCNEYVLNYKQLCRAHIAQLKPPDCIVDLDD
ncbi:uncharacterized protein LOC128724728 [Anopheles nili]|uniref:uncharacterized protein LOC128724728 n=1 Tax=Anopheles nili TaxID=185578 RepID=UPI00237B351E|nr:uncharacterized protein LOC128724728 [Anopheles nili]